MYSSAGSNQGNNRFSLHNKSTLASALKWWPCFFLDWTPWSSRRCPCMVRPPLDSPYHAQSRSDQHGGDWRHNLQTSFIIQDDSSLWLMMSLPNPNQTRHWFFKKITYGFSMTFWTLILQGFCISPLHAFMYFTRLLQRNWSGPLTWNIWGSASVPCLPVGQKGYTMIHCYSVSAYVSFLPKSASLQTLSGCGVS